MLRTSAKGALRQNASSVPPGGKRKTSPVLVDTTMTVTRSMNNVIDLEKDNVIDLSQDSSPSQEKRLRTSTSAKVARKPLRSVSLSSCNNRANVPPAVPAAKTQQNDDDDDDEVQIVPPVRTRRACKKEAGILPEATTNQQSVTPEPTQIRKPIPGDRFRVYYDAGDDIFGVMRPGGKGWHFGVVETVKKNKAPFSIVIRFDSGETSTFDYPAKDRGVERLLPSSDGKHIMMGEKEDFALDKNPAVLDVGDQVQCLYQDGACNGAWFRGRVAKICDDRNFCDIAYDDHEYEKFVPIGEARIQLIEDGRRFKHWLEGVKTKISTKSSQRKAEVTIKVLEDDEDMLGLQHSDGSIEKRSYMRVVRELFDEVKKNAKTVDWPTAVAVAKTKAEQPKAKRTVASKAKAAAPTNNTKKKAQLSQTGPCECCHPDDFVLDPWLSDACSDDDTEEDEPTKVTKEMSNSLRNSCWKILNSAEGPYGSDLLFKVTNFHNKMPNDQLCRDLIQLLWKGPTHSNGRIHFPDCTRMELANNYLALLKTKQGMGTKLANAIPRDFWMDCLDIIQQPAVIYCVEGDESRTTSAALQRVGQTLNVKNSGAGLLCYLLQHQLKGHAFLKSGGDVTKKQVEEFKAVLKTRELTCDILGCKDGISNALKRVVRAAFSVLIHYGHYLSNDFRFPDPPVKDDVDDATLTPPHATAADRSFVAAETRKLLKSMGKIVGYMSWLWSIEEGKSIYGAKYIISATAMSQLGDVRFDPSIFLSEPKSKSKTDKEKRMNCHWTDMKLQFALSLDKRISGSLGEKVADDLRVVTKYF